MKKIYTKMLAVITGLFLFQAASAQTTIFSENWSSSTFTTNNWTFPSGQGNWTMGSSYTPNGSTSPNAYFNWSPSMTNYTISLLSNTINATAYPGPITLSYLLKLDNFSSATVEKFIVEYKTVSGSTWNTVAIYSSTTTGTFNWAVNNYTLTGMEGQLFQLRFTAYGPDSGNLNGWGLDNIVVNAPCIPGLMVSATPSCSPGTRTLTASGSNNYTWTPGSSTGASIVVNPSVTTVYTVASTSSVASCVETRTITVYANPVTPTINVSGTSSICANSTITLLASGASTYSWSTGSNGSSAMVSPTATTVYSVTGTNGTGCSSSANFTVAVTNINLTANSASLCASSGSANLSVNAVAGTTVNWYATMTPTGAIATGTTYATPVVTANTTYYAQASNSTGGLNSIFTTTAAGNGSSGNMFDVVPSTNITWNGVDMSISSTGTVAVEIWYRTGTFVGFENSNTGWTNLLTTTVTSPGTGTLVNVSGFSANLNAGQTYGLYVTTNGGSVNYTNGTGLGNTYVSNSNLVVKEGKGGGYFSVTNSPRVFNGRLYYNGSGCTSAMTPVYVLVNWCVGLSTNTKSLLNLNAYPNPTNGEFTLELNNGLSKTIEVADLTGRIIKTIKTASDVTNVNLDGFASGLYYVKVSSNNTSETLKIVKQ
jgi:hypothetical protein